MCGSDQYMDTTRVKGSLKEYRGKAAKTYYRYKKQELDRGIRSCKIIQ